MKILQVTAPREFEILDVPTPVPASDEVLLRVGAVTTCPQWDLHLRHNEPMFPGHAFHFPYAPGQPGHEATGTIAALGRDVTEYQVGERVSTWRDPGHGSFGCYAQFVILKSADVIRVPSHLPLDATASLELAMCVGASFLMLQKMDALRDRRCGTMGLGPAGLIAAQMARAEGATEITGFDLSAERRERAVALGIVDAAFDSRAASSERFPLRPNTPMLDCAVDCVGAKASVEFLMDRTSDVVALFGVQREMYAFEPRHYSLRLCGYPGHRRAAAEYAVGLLERGALDLNHLVTHHLPLAQYGAGIELLETQQAVKVCFDPWND